MFQHQFSIRIAAVLVICIFLPTYAQSESGCERFDANTMNIEALRDKASEEALIHALSCAEDTIALAKQYKLTFSAVKRSQQDLLEWLVAQGVDVDAPDNRGMTPIHYAAQRGDHASVSLLYSAGASMTRKAPNGYAVFDFALESVHTNTMLTIITHFLGVKGIHQASVESISVTQESLPLLLIHAIVSDDEQRLKSLVAKGAKIDQHNITNYAPLPLAVRLGHESMMHLLLASGANPNIGNDGNDEAIPLNQAARGNQIQLAKILLNAGANINKENGRGYSALMLASMYGHSDFVSFLIENGAAIDQVNHRGSDALMMAAAYGRVEILAQLLNADASTEVHNNQHFSAMDYAMQQGHKDIVAHLVSHASNEYIARLLFEDKEISLAQKSPNLHQKSVLGFPVLNIAARFGHAELVDWLIQSGADPGLQTKSGYQTNALMSACQSGNLDIVRRIIATQIDVNAQDAHGDPAINWATANGHEAIVVELLGAGANPTIANKDGYTAIRTAKERGLEQLVAVLEKHQKQGQQEEGE